EQTIQRAHATHPITALQTEYSLWTRDPEDGILAACRQLGIGFVPYSPLGRGFLTGRFQSTADLGDNDFRKLNPRFQQKPKPKNLEIGKGIEQNAKEKGCTPAPLALAWVLAQGEDLAPIPGTKKRAYLDQNLGALDVLLTSVELQRLDEIAPPGITAGTRYPAA